MSNQLLTTSRDKAISLRSMLKGGAQLILTEATPRELHITSTLKEGKRPFGFLRDAPVHQVYMDGHPVCESRLAQNFDLPILTAKFSSGESIVVAERATPLIGAGLPGTTQRVSLVLPGFSEKKERSFNFAGLATLPIGTAVLVSYPFQRVTDAEGREWLTDGDLVAFPVQPPAKEERLQYPYALVPLGYWQGFCHSLKGKVIINAHALLHFAMDYMLSVRKDFHWILDEYGEEYLTTGEYFLRPNARPHIMRWSPSGDGGIDPSSLVEAKLERQMSDIFPERRRAFLDSLVGLTINNFHPCLVTFHQTVPFRWMTDAATGSRWLTNGFKKLPAGRDPESWLISDSIPMGFWDTFTAGLEGLTMDEIRDYARQYASDIVGVFRWVTEGDKRWMANGQPGCSLPEACPRGTEWQNYRRLVKKAIEPRYWPLYLAALENKPLGEVLDIEPQRLIREAQEARPPVLNERQRRVRAVIAKLWTGGGRCEPIEVGIGLLFPVNREDELGDCSVVDVPQDDVSIYAFEDAEEARTFAREGIPRSEIRRFQCHIDHIGDDWDDELEWVLRHVRARDFKNPERWRRPPVS